MPLPTPLFSLVNPARGLAVCAVALLMVACGGGSDPAPTAQASQGATASTADAAASAPGTSTASTASTTVGTCGLANFEADLLARVNALRAAGATCGTRGAFATAPALAWNAHLTQAGLVHANDMQSKNFFSHTGDDGRNAGQRATAAGYNWQSWGENIAAGHMGTAAVLEAWMDSPDHCAAIMTAGYQEMGVACVPGTNSNTFRTYWTQMFGAQRAQ